MGCTSSKQQSPEEESSAPNHGGFRQDLAPPKPTKTEDAYNRTGSSGNQPVPAGWSRRTVNEPTRSKTATGPSDQAQSQISESESAAGLPPTWGRVGNRVADRGDVGQLTQASINESYATNLRDKKWTETHVNSFLNAGKAEVNRGVETRKMKTQLGVM